MKHNTTHIRQRKSGYKHPRWRRWFVLYLDRITRGDELPLNIQYGARWASEATRIFRRREKSILLFIIESLYLGCPAHV
jgi:hypothetical protein